MTVIVEDEAVAPAEVGIDPSRDLWCGERVHPDGDIAVPVPLAGTPRTEICEHPAKFVVGDPRIVEVEKEVIDDNLETTTEIRKRNQLAVLACGVHKERAVEHFEARRCDGGGRAPRVTPLAETEGR